MAVKELETTVTYGMGAECQNTLALSEFKGKPLRQIIKTVADSPQSSEEAFRVARTIKEIVCSGRTVDVEVSVGRDTENTLGKPMELDDIVIPDTDNSPVEKTGKLNIGLSEDYVGGLF